MASAVNFGTQQYFGFDPRTIPGCALWLDGADSTTLTTSGGGNVTQWRDKSGNGSTMTPVGTQSNATIQTNYRNGLSAVNFSGINVYRTVDGTGVYPSDVYILVALKTLTRMDVIAIGTTTGGGNFNSLTFGEHTALRWHNGSDFFNRTPLMVSPTNETSTSLLLMNWSLANNNFVIRRNGTQLVTTASYTYTLTAPSSIQLGFRHTELTSTTLPFDAYVAEVVTFNRQIVTAERQQVEGYLAWKWRLQTNLPASHPYRYVPPAMRDFTPPDAIGPTFWLDAADATTFTLSGSTITQWRDKSSNQYAGTPSGSPVQTTLNGRPAVAFNGSTQYFDFGDVADLGAANLNIFCVAKFNSTANGSLFAKSAAAAAAFRYSLLRESGNLLTLLESSGGLQGVGSVADSSLATRVLSWTWDRTTNILYLDGTLASSVALASSATFNSAYNLLVGAYNNSSGTTPPVGGFYLDGVICEILFLFGTLTSTQRQQIEGYLAWKWGLRGSLPTTHPFYLAPPVTPLFTPTLLTNTCAVWFDAADTTTITGTTQVTTWVNKGSVAGNATNRTGSCTSGSTVNGLNYVRCPVGADLQFTAALNTQARSWFYVARQVTALTSGTFAGLLNQLSGTGQNTIVIAYVNATTVAPFMGPTAVRVSVAADVPAATLSSIYLLSIVNSATVSLNAFTLNGTAQTLKSSAAAADYRTASSTYLLGTAGYNTAVDIMEAICYYGDVSVDQRQRVEGYLAWKWGLQASLPTTHAYAKFRP